MTERRNTKISDGKYNDNAGEDHIIHSLFSSPYCLLQCVAEMLKGCHRRSKSGQHFFLYGGMPGKNKIYVGLASLETLQ